MPLVWSPPLYSRKEYITAIRIKEEGLENPKKNPEFREMLQQCRQEWEQAPQIHYTSASNSNARYGIIQLIMTSLSSLIFPITVLVY